MFDIIELENRFQKSNIHRFTMGLELWEFRNLKSINIQYL